MASEFEWQADRHVPLTAILGPLRRGSGDPTMTIGDNQLWWAVATPHGPAATWWRRFPRPTGSGDRVVVRAYGPGAGWFEGRVGLMLGESDDVSSFVPDHPRMHAALRHERHRSWRVARTGLVITSLIPSILEQKVTGKQAFGGFRELVRHYGTAAPFGDEAIAAAGPHAARVARMRVAPEARGWRRIPSWAWLQAGVEPPQSRTVMRALDHAERLEETGDMPLADAHRRMRAVPGLGVWTTAKVAQTAWGDADAPTFADYHVAKEIGHAMLGRDVDDAGMAELLEPYRGHRYRAEWLLLVGGPMRERHGARMSLPSHLPTRSNRGAWSRGAR